MKRAFSILLCAAGISCGGPRAPAPVVNQADPVEPVAAPVEPADAAVLVSRSATGGTLELRGDRDLGHADAQAKMTEHCGAENYQITSESEEIIGADTYSDGTGRVTRNEVRAWRIHYACLGP